MTDSIVEVNQLNLAGIIKVVDLSGAHCFPFDDSLATSISTRELITS